MWYQKQLPYKLREISDLIYKMGWVGNSVFKKLNTYLQFGLLQFGKFGDWFIALNYLFKMLKYKN